MPYNTKKINIAYKSKNNLTQKRQIILLMINDGQKWHYLVVKNLSGLSRGITSNHKEDFYCFIVFITINKKCKKEFNNNDKKNYKVRDHCHYTGKYRGAAHNICNLRYKVPKEIPIVFHNGSIYEVIERI